MQINCQKTAFLPSKWPKIGSQPARSSLFVRYCRFLFHYFKDHLPLGLYILISRTPNSAVISSQGACNSHETASLRPRYSLLSPSSAFFSHNFHPPISLIGPISPISLILTYSPYSPYSPHRPIAISRTRVQRYVNH